MKAPCVRRSAGALIALTGIGVRPAAAEPPVLDVPILCAVGVECFVQKYYDHDPGAGWSDYMCGPLASPGHAATDFRLRDLVAMRAGVAVVAAVPGTVRAVRDGMADVDVHEIGEASVAGREAGNVVILSHGGGWETYYGHLMKDSIAVGRGDRVEAGQFLGLVGLSGNTEFPHVEFGVLHEGEAVDPFVGVAPPEGCGLRGTPLWSADAMEGLPYVPTGVLGAGWHTEAPDAAAARAGSYPRTKVAASAAALVFWVDLFGTHEGDIAKIRIVGPDGEPLLEHEKPLGKTQAQTFLFFGRKQPHPQWPKGLYRAEFSLERSGADGAPVVRLVRALDVY